MPWCPKCKREYKDEQKICKDCGSDLIEKPHEDKEVFLVSVRDDMEAKIIEAKLRAYGIPVLKKYKGTGEYMSVIFGSTIFGIDIYVPSSLLERSIDLISEDSIQEK